MANHKYRILLFQRLHTLPTKCSRWTVDSGQKRAKDFLDLHSPSEFVCELFLDMTAQVQACRLGRRQTANCSYYVVIGDSSS